MFIVINLPSNYRHYDIGLAGEDCGFTNTFKYGAMSGDFYRIDTTGTNSSADWDWKFLDTHLAMACGVAVDDKRIYVSGGFHVHSKSSSLY